MEGEGAVMNGYAPTETAAPTPSQARRGAPTGVAPLPIPILATIKAGLPLIKPRVVVLLAVAGLVAFRLGGASHGVTPTFGRVALFVLFASMTAGGAACLNHLFEQDLDARMERTRNRPLPSGRIQASGARLLALALFALSLGPSYAVFGVGPTALLAAGAAIYAGIYTVVLKRRTSANIVIGGSAGSAMVLAGWLAGGGTLDLPAWIFALIIFLWTPPHFWSLAVALDTDYRRAGIPMLPQVAGVPTAAVAMIRYALATWAASMALGFFTPLGPIYLAAAALLGASLTAGCIHFRYRPDPPNAWRLFKGSGAYLLLLLIAMVVDQLAR